MKDFLAKYKTPLRVVGGLVILVAVVLTFAWCSASSGDGVPKANEYNRQSANAEIESIKLEANANVAAAQIEVVEAKRQTALADANTAIAEKDKAVNNLRKRNDDYETFKKKGVVVSGDNLDARERKLLADLTNTYTPNR